MKFALITSTLVVCAIAAGQSPKVLLRRQSSDCPSGYKVCGDGCIELSYTCCPDGSGGCDATENCQLGSNGEYGCCPKGESCSGEGGAITTDIIDTSTQFFPGTSSFSTATTSAFLSSCPSGYQVCGDGCIPLSYTCCPDGSGGCDASEVCQLGSNGEYGCCPIGETCVGSGGAITTGSVGTLTSGTTRTSSDLFDTSSLAVATTTQSLAATTSTRSTRTTPTSTTENTATGTASNPVASVIGNTGDVAYQSPFASFFSLIMAVAALLV